MSRIEIFDEIHRASVRDDARERFIANSTDEAAAQYASETDRIMADACAKATAERIGVREEEDRLKQAEATELAHISVLNTEREKGADDYTQATAKIAESIGEKSASYSRLVTEKRDAEVRVKELQAAVKGRGLWVHVPPAAYFPIMAVYAVGETPLTAPAFRLVFQQDAWVAWLFSALAGGMLVAFAHFSGGGLRQFFAPTLNRFSHLGRAAGIAALTTAAVGLMYVVAALRQQYFDELQAGDGGSIASAILAGASSVETMIDTVRAVTLKGAGLDFFWINAAVYTLGCALSFLSRDPHPDYAKAIADKKSTADALASRQDQIAAAKTACRDEYKIVKDRLDPVIEERRRELSELKKKQSVLSGKLDDDLKSIASWAHQLLLEYRSVFYEEMAKRRIGFAVLDAPSVAELLRQLRAASWEDAVSDPSPANVANVDAQKPAEPSKVGSPEKVT